MVKQLLAIRQSSVALNHGRYVAVPHGMAGVMAYLRSQGAVKMLVVLNFADAEKLLNLEMVGERGSVLLSTEMDRTGMIALDALKIRPHEGLLIQIA